jgi:DHA2 family multidrug resistance protein
MQALRSRGGIKIDYVGIGLIALGLGCLEVVLDKGQEDDWFGSPFIVCFTVLAALGLGAGLIWEFFESDPVIDLSLLRERNFALANLFYFVFGFTLYGSTVLVPQWLQSLQGYTATLAGLVLTPGACVIVALAPIVVRLNAKLGSRPLIAAGFFIVAAAMWCYGRLDLSADYGAFVFCRLVHGLGIALLFVPTSQVAYSFLPSEKNSKASSLTNLFRNEGASFGIAFATTLLARRSQFHQSILTTHVSPYDPAATSWIHQVSAYFAHVGFSIPDALERAQARLVALVDQQAHLLAFLDCHLLLGLVALAGFGAAFLIRKTPKSFAR